MRRRLFAAVSLTALLSAPAFAQETTVDDERTEPVDTATADNGSPANLIIGANGRVRLTNQTGPAVRVNSDNDLTIEPGGTIEILDTDANGDNVVLSDAIGVQVDPGVTGNITHGGDILLGDSYEPPASDDETVDPDRVDTDGDGEPDSPDTEVDGPFAEDLRKIGLLIGELDGNYAPTAGQAGVTGNLTTELGSRILVRGQDSYGIRVAAPLDGDLISNGRIQVVGERSTGIAVENGVTGDVEIGLVTARSPGGNGVSLEGDIGGGVRLTTTVEVSGYRTTTRTISELMALFDEGDDNLDSGSAIVIAGSVVDGVFIARNADIQLYSGSGAGIDIGRGGETITIGTATVPDDFDVLEADEDDAEDTYDYAVVNRGTINSRGIFDGKSTTGFLIGGRDDQGQLRAVILAGDGFLNSSNILARSFDAEAVGLRVGEGTQADTINNEGVIDARSFIGYSDDDLADTSYRQTAAFGIILDEGSAIRQLLNSGDIIASVQEGSLGGGATAVRIDSDSVELVLNEGLISAGIGAPAPTDIDDTDPTRIAIDARNHDGGLTIRQQRAVDENGDPVDNRLEMVGDILFGDGDDTLEILDGSIEGDISFGIGADRLIVDGAQINGAVNDADANLTIDVTNGRIILGGEDSIALTDATFNDGGILEIRIETASRTGAFFDASGAVSFAEGSDLTVSLSGLLENVTNFELVSAGSLSIADEAILNATDAPYLYNADISRAEGDPNTLLLTLSRKTADELGMNVSQAAAYDEAFAAMTAINELGNAFAAIQTADDFFGAYNQLLPEYASSAIQFALASNDAAAGALSSRLRNARLSPDDLAGVWVQEFGYFADRNATSFGPGYRGQGVGLAMGIDRPVGPFYAMGFHLVGAASEVEEIDGFDEPMVAISGQFGTYAAIDLGGVDLSGSFGVGYDYFETERNILIDSFSTVNTAEWSGWHLTASAQAGRDFQVGAWTLRPEASLTWLSLFESGYTEQNEDPDFNQLALIVDDRESSVLTAGATFTVGRRFGTDISWWAPSFRLGYRGELLGEDMDTVAQFGESGSPFTLQSEALPGSGILGGFGLSAGSQYTTFTFAYDTDVRDDFIRHVARLVVRLTF
ncbi:autotransporter outer membrane beta-barrel domain-containing protein [Maricaulaceae bacterium EIL42A08]|nr:autotransporter outer membrane beta-barrel domain-containing protein [Maricaulaceae bacterium EIL42A08]